MVDVNPNQINTNKSDIISPKPKPTQSTSGSSRNALNYLATFLIGGAVGYLIKPSGKFEDCPDVQCPGDDYTVKCFKPDTAQSTNCNNYTALSCFGDSDLDDLYNTEFKDLTEPKWHFGGLTTPDVSLPIQKNTSATLRFTFKCEINKIRPKIIITETTGTLLSPASKTSIGTGSSAFYDVDYTFTVSNKFTNIDYNVSFKIDIYEQGTGQFAGQSKLIESFNVILKRFIHT